MKFQVGDKVRLTKTTAYGGIGIGKDEVGEVVMTDHYTGECYVEMDQDGFTAWLKEDLLELETLPQVAYPAPVQSQSFGGDPAQMKPHVSCCQHDWALYEGIYNRFEYCSKCDVKRSVA